ncbi:T9SS type A sorting domain-containing protein [Aquiflexum sp.]
MTNGTYTQTITTSDLAAGMYIVRSITDKGSSARRFIVVH